MLEGPYVFSINGLTDRGRDRYGSIPEVTTAGQRWEIGVLHAAAARRQAAEARAEAEEGEDHVISVHVVPAQSVHILAMCDLEKHGMSFHQATEQGESKSWIAIRGGEGIRLHRQGGLSYLHATAHAEGGIAIGSGGDIRFLVDTGAQASLIAVKGVSMAAGLEEPSITLTAAGGGILDVARSGTLTIRVRHGSDSLECIAVLAPANLPASIFIGAVKNSALDIEERAGNETTAKVVNMVKATRNSNGGPGMSYLQAACNEGMAGAARSDEEEEARYVMVGEAIRKRKPTEDEGGVPRQFSEWIAGLEDQTIIAFAQGSKEQGSQAAIRHKKYRGAKTLGEYRRAQTTGFALRDLLEDLTRGHASFNEETWRNRIALKASITEQGSIDAFSEVFRYHSKQPDDGARMATMADIVNSMAYQPSPCSGDKDCERGNDSVRFLEASLLGRKGAVRRVLHMATSTGCQGLELSTVRGPSEEMISLWVQGSGFTQSVVDRRIFAKTIKPLSGGSGIFVIGLFDGDVWTQCECPEAWKAFHAKWCTRFKPFKMHHMKRRVIKGITYSDSKGGKVEVSCEEAISELRDLLQEAEARQNLGLVARTVEWEREVHDRVRFIADNERADLHIDVGMYVPREIVGEKDWSIVVAIALNMTLAGGSGRRRLIYRPHSRVDFDTKGKTFASGDTTTIKHRWRSFGGGAPFQWDTEVTVSNRLSSSEKAWQLTQSEAARAKKHLEWKMLRRELLNAPTGAACTDHPANKRAEEGWHEQRYQSQRFWAATGWIKERILHRSVKRGSKKSVLDGREVFGGEEWSRGDDGNGSSILAYDDEPGAFKIRAEYIDDMVEVTISRGAEADQEKEVR